MKVWIVVHIACIEHFVIEPKLVGLIGREIVDLESDAWCDKVGTYHQSTNENALW